MILSFTKEERFYHSPTGKQMIPYGTFYTRTGKPEEFPDVADLLRDGRPSRCRHIARTSNNRRQTRRRLNRVTRNIHKAEIKKILQNL